MSQTQQAQFFSKLESSLIQNEKFKDTINTMEYNLFQGKSEVNRLKTELKILREVPVNERTNLV
jgi:hypothetical protein